MRRHTGTMTTPLNNNLPRAKNGMETLLIWAMSMRMMMRTEKMTVKLMTMMGELEICRCNNNKTRMAMKCTHMGSNHSHNKFFKSQLAMAQQCIPTTKVTLK